MTASKKEMKDFSNFVKYLVELGDVYWVDEAWFVMKKINDEPVGMTSNGKALPMVIYHEKLKIGDYVILNPFGETLGNNQERNWFFTSRSAIVAHLVYKCIKEIVTLAISSDTEDLGYDKLKFVTPYIEMVDAKTLKELDKLKPMDIADIFYHNKSKTAQLQTKLYEEDYQKSLGGKIRKKTWNFLQKVMEDIFKTSAIEELYIHKSNMIGMQECDAVLSILYKVCKRIEEPVKALLDIDLDVATFSKNIDHLEDYHKMSRWIVGGSKKDTTKIESLDKPPWENSSLPSGDVPAASQKLIMPNGNSSVPEFGNTTHNTVPSFGGFTPSSSPITYAGQSTSISYAHSNIAQPMPGANPFNSGWNPGGRLIMP